MKNVKMLLNGNLNGVELYFDEKPSEETRSNLKALRFRWSRNKNCWYAKQNDQTLKFAEELSNGETAEAPKKAKKSIVSKVFDLFKSTRLSNIVAPKEVINDTKEIAKICRTELRRLFPMVKFSVTISRFSGGSEILCSVKSSPFEKDSIYLKSIMEYATKLINSYNWDKSDIMTDYFNMNFYFFDCKPDWDYQVVENDKFDIEAIKALFDEQENRRKAEEEEQQEREYKEYLIKIAEEEKERIKAEEERQNKEKEINNNVKVIDLEESSQYMVNNVTFPRLNKNSNLKEVKEELNKGSYYQDCKITKEIYFNDEKIYNNFCTMFLHDFSFLKGCGGSYTDDKRINEMSDFSHMEAEERKSVKWNLYGIAIYLNDELKLIVDPQGYAYCRYVGIVDTVTSIQKDSNSKEEYKQVLTAEELKENEENAKKIINVLDNVYSDIDINDLYINPEKMDLIKETIINNLKNNSLHLNKGYIQAIREDITKHSINYKEILYKCLDTPISVNKQMYNLKNSIITIVKNSMLGGASVNYLHLQNVEEIKNGAIKLIGKIKGKRGLYEMIIKDNDKTLIYQGQYDLKEVLYNITTENNFTITSTKYSSCDTKAFDDIITYMINNYNLRPVISTYKTII